MQFSFTIIIFTAILGLGSGYLLKSTEDSREFIEQQQKLLSYQMVYLEGQPFRLNRYTGELHKCAIQRNPAGEPTHFNCTVRLKK